MANETNTAAPGMGDAALGKAFREAAATYIGPPGIESFIEYVEHHAAALAAQPAPVVVAGNFEDWFKEAHYAESGYVSSGDPTYFDQMRGHRYWARRGYIAGLEWREAKEEAQPAPVVGGDAEPWGYADPKSGRSIHRNLITSTVKVGALGEVGEMVDASTIYTVPLYTHPAPLLAARPGGDDTRRLDALERLLNQQADEMLLLHNGRGVGKGIVGLGLRNTGRSLRKAIDDATAAHPAQAGGESSNG